MLAAWIMDGVLDGVAAGRPGGRTPQRAGAGGGRWASKHQAQPPRANIAHHIDPYTVVHSARVGPAYPIVQYFHTDNFLSRVCVYECVRGLQYQLVAVCTCLVSTGVRPSWYPDT